MTSKLTDEPKILRPKRRASGSALAPRSLNPSPSRSKGKLKYGSSAKSGTTQSGHLRFSPDYHGLIIDSEGRHRIERPSEVNAAKIWSPRKPRARRRIPRRAAEISEETLGDLGRAMSKRLMPEIVAKHPGDAVVMFLVESGKYITAKDDTALLDKYEALHQDKWGWVTDIVRGAGDKSEGVGRP